MKKTYLFLVLIVTCLIGFSAQADEVRLGRLFYKNFTVPNNTFTTIIAPATNVAGAKITTVILYHENGGVTLSADYPDGSHRYILQGTRLSPGTTHSTHLPYPIFLPSGVGLSVIASDTTQAGCHITYDLMAQ